MLLQLLLQVLVHLRHLQQLKGREGALATSADALLAAAISDWRRACTERLLLLQLT
jgi:hypothetical protein